MANVGSKSVTTRIIYNTHVSNLKNKFAIRIRRPFHQQKQQWQHNKAGQVCRRWQQQRRRWMIATTSATARKARANKANVLVDWIGTIIVRYCINIHNLWCWKVSFFLPPPNKNIDTQFKWNHRTHKLKLTWSLIFYKIKLQSFLKCIFIDIILHSNSEKIK